MQIYDKQISANIGEARLNYAKLILAKVSFNASLFEKELKKAITSLLPQDILQLEEWCYLHFDEMYASTLQQCFANPHTRFQY